MAGPITWRNVDSPSLGIPGQSLLGAQQSINGAFDTFQKIIQQREAVDASNLAAGQTNLRQNFLDALQGARTEEELAALKASGKLDALRNDMSPQMRAQLLGKEDVRLNDIRQNLVANQDFTAGQAARAAAPSIDQVMLTANNGDFAGAKAMLANLNVPNKAQTLAAINALELQNINRKRDDTKYGNQQTLDTLRIAEAQRNAEDVKTNIELKSGLAEASAAHQRKVAEIRTAAGEVGKSLGYSVNSDGTLNLSALDSEKRAKVDEALKARGLGSVSILERGDTAAKTNFLESLRKTGKYREDQLAGLDALANTAFDSSGYASIGNDALTKASEKAARDAIDRENKFRLGEIATPETMAGLQEAGISLIKGLATPGTFRYESYLQQLSKFLNEGGYKVKGPDGKETRFLPSVEQLKLLLGTANTSHGFFGITGLYQNDITAPLEKWANSSTSKDAAEAELKAFARRTRESIQKEPKM